MLIVAGVKVVLVHGIFDSGLSMSRLAGALVENGHQTFCPDLIPSNGEVSLEVLAKQLSEFVNEVMAVDESFALVGFSMGALVSRIFLQDLGGDQRVVAFYSISGPHSGSLMALFGRGTGAREMRPGSSLLKRLDTESERLGDVQIVCYWTPFDQMVFPPRSACWSSSGEKVTIFALAHPLMLRAPKLMRDLVNQITNLITPTIPPAMKKVVIEAESEPSFPDSLFAERKPITPKTMKRKSAIIP